MTSLSEPVKPGAGAAALGGSLTTGAETTGAGSGATGAAIGATGAAIGAIGAIGAAIGAAGCSVTTAWTGAVLRAGASTDGLGATGAFGVEMMRAFGCCPWMTGEPGARERVVASEGVNMLEGRALLAGEPMSRDAGAGMRSAPGEG